MNRCTSWAFVAIVGVAALGVSPSGVMRGQVTSHESFAKRVVTTGLADPFQMVWGPDDYLWVTERTAGRVTRVRPSDGSRTTAITIGGDLQADGPGGVLGMALDPGLLKGTGNDFVYVAYTFDADPSATAVSRRTRIVRFTYNRAAQTLGDPKDILTNLPAGTDHQGGRLVFGPDRRLYFSIGDLGANQLANFCKPDLSQALPTAAQVRARDWSLYEGKVLRLNLDGSIPADNPTIAGVKSHIYSYGHRNPQGLVFMPDGKLYESEHGPNTDDEVNLIQPGKNYGWPHVAGHIDDQSYAYANWSASKDVPCRSLKFTAYPEVAPSVPMQKETQWSHPDFTPPIQTYHTVPTGYDFKNPKCADRALYYQCWPTVAPSSLAAYAVKNGIPGWNHSLLMPSLKHGTVFRIQLDAGGTAVVGDPDAHEHFKTVNRYRDVVVSPDGLALFIATDPRGNTQDESGRPAASVENPGSILEFRYVTEKVGDVVQGWAGTPPSPEAPLEPRAPATVKEGEIWIPPLPAMESVAPPAGWVTSGPDVPPMPLTLLRLPRTNITRAKFPAIDFHVHARELTTPAAYQSFVKLMDSIGMGAIANMDGGTGQALDAALKAGEGYRDRVATFVTFNPDGINEPGWSQRFAAEMERGFNAGALGLKVWKTLGQVVKNPDGSFIQADDPRLDPIWAMAAKHGKPVMIHISDSIGRFYPIGPKNERYEAGLWRRPGDTSENLFRDGPRREVIEKARENMHRKHPKTRFVNAHMAMLYYDPQKLAAFLDTYPNADVETSATFQDLGRAPRLWREFIIKYQDRILMGSDGSPSRGADEFWIPHWRYLETYDEYFYHPAQIRTPGGSPGHGRWNISGIGLPDAVLRKIYYQNALRHLPSLRPSIERQLAARQNRANGVIALPEPKSTIVPRIAGDVKIDGVLDEGAWQKAARMTPFVQHDTMAVARVDTEVRVWYDRAALYLGWICEDGDIQATFTERDSRFWEEEVVEFFVTPGALDRYVELQWNPLGGTFDAIITNEIAADGRSRRFEGDWSYTATNMTYAVRVAGSVQNSNDRDQRWTVEVRIPFVDLNVRTPERGDVWRANFYRFNRDRNREPELLSWSPTIWPGFHQPTRFGYLRFSGE